MIPRKKNFNLFVDSNPKDQRKKEINKKESLLFRTKFGSQKVKRYYISK